MPKNKLTDYSATNASNTDVGGINIDEGMLPSDVNNAIREVMTHLKEFEDGTNGITKLSAADAEITGTGAIKVPVGTTAQRPTPATGQLRFNSTDSSFEGYDGSAWGAIGGGSENSFIVYEYTATASQTTFSGADDNAATLAYTAGNIQVMLNGVVLDPSDFTATNGTSVVLASGAALNDVLNVYAFTSFTVADTVSASAGGTFSANVAFAANATFGDNDKAIFGAGSDLQIYHDGSNSYIQDTATGQLLITTQGAYIALQKNLTETMAQFIPDGSVDLYYDNSRKLATTSGGIDVTGTITTDGLTVDAGGSRSYFNSSHVRLSDNYNLEWGGGTNYVRGSNASNYLLFATNSSEALRIDSSGNLLVGKTSAATSTAGVQLASNGRVEGAVDGGEALRLNRISSDGDIAVFRKDNSEVGLISAWSSSLLIGTGDVGLAFVDGTPERIQPRKADDQTSADGLIDLGHTSNRFKDLYLSGAATCAAGASNVALQAYHPTSTSSRDIAKFQSNVGGTQEDKVVIKCDGSVGIGTSSPSVNAEIRGSASNGQIRLGGSTTGTYGNIYSDNDGVLILAADAGNNAASSYFGIEVDGLEAMRINSSGNLLVGKTSDSTSAPGVVIYNSNGGTVGRIDIVKTFSGAANALANYYSGTYVGGVNYTNTSTSLVTSSDYRLKENVTADWDATTRLKQLNPVRFNFIAEPDTTVDGFLAHEVQDIVPEAISGTKDAVDNNGNPVYQGIDHSKLVPLLVKTIQELEARIAALENA